MKKGISYLKPFQCQSRLLSTFGGVVIEPLVTSSVCTSVDFSDKQLTQRSFSLSIGLCSLYIDCILTELIEKKKHVPFLVQNRCMNRPIHLQLINVPFSGFADDFVQTFPARKKDVKSKKERG